ncbi:MAG TPA: T9SS type A sorting domain-containing protein [Hymenobacter sp.]|nr:T9SS type A sorting domain-containing protein [Hymenobacter sp.]
MVLLIWVASMAGSTARAADRVYYSTGDSISVSSGSGRVSIASKVQAGVLSLAASVRAPSLLGPAATVRLPLSGVAPAGYRAGVLVSTNNTGLLSTRLLETVTLRTYLRNALRETQPVSATVLQLALLAAAGQPQQLEFTTSLSFDRVEVSFDPGALSLNLLSYPTTNILYAYAVAPGVPKLVTGYLSQFGSATNGLYSTANSASLPVAVCAASTVVNPQHAVDNSLTNYAAFTTLAGLGCASTLQVKLAGTVPGQGYRAGFVVGSAGLLDVGLLNGLRLRTFLGGAEQEASGAGSLLNVQLLADDQAFVSFPATKAFDGVSIERSAAVALANDLRLYYGFGLAEDAFTTSPIVTSFDFSQGRYTSRQGGVVCAGCGSNLATAGGQTYLRLSQGIAAGGTNSARLELNGPGLAGNRAGIVLGQNTLLNLGALANVVLATYDAAGNVLETASSPNLLNLSVLPDSRQEISFHTTRNFAQVGLIINQTLAASADVNVYSAFADDLGLLQVQPAAGPLPVVLTSFGVRRAPGGPAADVAWATASEQRSAYFVVERATQPQAGFVAVGQVAAAGSSVGPRRYTLRDAAAPTRTTSYYRLRQVDADGTESLSPVVALAPLDGAGAGFALYPNPSPAGAVTLSFDGPVAEGTTAVIYSPVGQVLRRQPVRAAAEQPATVSTAGLPAGIYHVVLRDAAGQPLGTQRLVVSN